MPPDPADPPAPDVDPAAEASRRRRAGEPLPAELVAPHPARFTGPADHPALVAHAEAVEDEADGYVDPASGLFSFTARYHWEKGRCCEMGCRHCPWLDADARLSGELGR